MANISRQHAFLAALASGVVIGLLYWGIQTVLRMASPIVVGLLVFIIGYLGMRGWKI